MNQAKLVKFQDMDCVRLEAGGYLAMIAPQVGSNVIRLCEQKHKIEFFRFSPDNDYAKLIQSAEVWGLPTLYLPNRFADGILKTSDAVYQLPVNEPAPYHNHIHGFLHKRTHRVTEMQADDNTARCRTEYLYDENDEFFQYLPIKFRAEFLFTLSANGLEYEFKLTNLSDKKMPVSVATHTAMNSPFVVTSKEQDQRIIAPVGKRWVLNSRCLPTGEFVDLTQEDQEYRNGTRCPVLRNIDNEMYFGEYMNLNGEPFYGIVLEDTGSRKKICYKVGEEYKFWIFWNDKGFNHYFCPEPMSAMIDAPNLDLPDGVTGYCELDQDESKAFYQHFYVLE
ncbi:MAG: aldose 1-epimerase [Oscillospiraceae bacterium]|nr:aldose 1-epimerase [Oscillospiraceae bacterium]